MGLSPKRRTLQSSVRSAIYVTFVVTNKDDDAHLNWYFAQQGIVLVTLLQSMIQFFFKNILPSG